MRANPQPAKSKSSAPPCVVCAAAVEHRRFTQAGRQAGPITSQALGSKQQQQNQKERVCVVRSPHQTAAILTCSRLWFGGRVFSLDFPWPFVGSGAALGRSGPDLIRARRHSGAFEPGSGGAFGSEISGKLRSKFCARIFFSSTHWDPTDDCHCLAVCERRSMLGQRRAVSTSWRR